MGKTTSRNLPKLLSGDVTLQNKGLADNSQSASLLCVCACMRACVCVGACLAVCKMFANALMTNTNSGTLAWRISLHASFGQGSVLRSRCMMNQASVNIQSTIQRKHTILVNIGRSVCPLLRDVK